MQQLYADRRLPSKRQRKRHGRGFSSNTVLVPQWAVSLPTAIIMLITIFGLRYISSMHQQGRDMKPNLFLHGRHYQLRGGARICSNTCDTLKSLFYQTLR
jgi:hypothetical protein